MATAFFNGPFFGGDYFSTSIPGPSVDWQAGGAGYPVRSRTRRRRTYELFQAMEQTLREMVLGKESVPEVHAVVAPLLDLSNGVGPALDQLLATAGEYEDLSRRVAKLKADITIYRRQEALSADEDEWMMWL